MAVTYNFFGEVGVFEQSAERVSQFLESIPSSETVILRIHSVGGDVFEGQAIFNLFRSAPNPVEVEVIGMAASMASVIMMAGDVVRMAANATVMIHSPMSFSFGNAAEKEKEIEVLRTIESSMLALYSAKTGISEDEFAARFFDGQDHWLDARDAVELGIADDIIPAELKVAASANAVVAYSKYIMENTQENENAKIEIEFENESPEMEAVEEVEEIEESELEAIRQKLEKLEAEFAELEKENEELILSMAEGKSIEPQMFEAIAIIAKTDREKALEMVTKYEAPKKAKSNISKIVSAIEETEPKDDRSSWTWKEYAKNAPEELARIQASNPERFQSLVNAYKARR